MATQLDISRVDFLQYLSTEEHNLLASLVNLRTEFDLFFNLDRVYKSPMSRLKLTAGEELVPALYLFVHYHLFSSMSNLLRIHVADSMGQLRKAIDAGLTAYELILRPERAEAYLNRDRFFLSIKRNIADARKKNQNAYPLASELLSLHEKCSEFGSHADITTFTHRLRFVPEEAGGKAFLFEYFQKPNNNDEFRFYLLCVLHAYFLIFKIFKEYFDRELKIVDSEWERLIDALEKKLPTARRAALEASNVAR